MENITSAEAAQRQTQSFPITFEKDSAEDDMDSPIYGKLQSPTEPASKELRRQRNTVAARKYRQKRLDRITELELKRRRNVII